MNAGIIILSILLAIALIIIVIQAKVIDSIDFKLDYYRSRLLKMVANDTLVEESFSILCEAYHVNENDLRDYISKYQANKKFMNDNYLYEIK